MEHQKAISNDYVDRYLRGDLEPHEAEDFEQHYLGCSECLDELAHTQSLRDGLGALVESGELEAPASDAGASTPRRTPFLAMAASVLVVVGLIATGVVLQSQKTGIDGGAAEVFDLVAVRSAPGDPPVNVVRAAEHTETLVLQFDSGEIGMDGTYTATLTREDGAASPLKHDTLRPDADGVLSLAVAADRLRPGDYRIDVRKADSSAVLNRVRFRMTGGDE